MVTISQWKFSIKGAKYVSQRKPVITKNTVLATFNYGRGINMRGTVVALDVANGREIWRFNSEHILNEPIVRDRYLGSPLRDCFIYLTCFDGKVYKLNRDGEVVWQIQPSHCNVWQPLLVNDLLVYAEIAGRAKNTWAVNILDGSIQWQYEHGGHAYALASDAEHIVYSTVRGSFDSKEIVLQCLDSQTGKPIWKTFSQQYLFRPIIIGGIIYIGSRGYVAAFCLKTGRLLAQYHLKESVAVTIPPLVTDDGIIFCTEAGQIFSLQATQADSKFLLSLNWQIFLDSDVNANLLKQDDKLLVISEKGELIKIDFKKGQISQKQKLSGFKQGFGMAICDRETRCWHDRANGSPLRDRDLIIAVSRDCVKLQAEI